MRAFRISLAAFLATLAAPAQQSGPALPIDASANRLPDHGVHDFRTQRGEQRRRVAVAERCQREELIDGLLADLFDVERDIHSRTRWHGISPDIYGINFDWDLGDANDPKRAACTAAALDIRAIGRRSGGNGASTCHWKLDVNSLANDCYYEVLPDTSVNAALLPERSTFDRVADHARAAKPVAPVRVR